jgi:GTP cyclohydrolase II
MAAAGEGVIVYLRQEGRGIGLADKLRAYNLQDLGLDTVDANLALGRPSDARVYGVASAILLDLGLGKKNADRASPSMRGIRLLTNNPEKLSAIENAIPVQERVPLIPVARQATGGSSTDAVSQRPELYKYIKIKVSTHLFANVITTHINTFSRWRRWGTSLAKMIYTRDWLKMACLHAHFDHLSSIDVHI